MAFKFPRVNTFCCGCSLRVGVFIIAFINLALILLLTYLHIIFGMKKIQYRRISEVEFVEAELLDITMAGEFIFALCLVYANFKNNPSYMMPFLVLRMSVVLLMLLWFLNSLVLHISGRFLFEEMFLPVIVFALAFYSIIIVHSQYKNLKEGQAGSS